MRTSCLLPEESTVGVRCEILRTKLINQVVVMSARYATALRIKLAGAKSVHALLTDLGHQTSLKHLALLVAQDVLSLSVSERIL